MKSNLTIDKNYILTEKGNLGKFALIAGILGIVASAAGYTLDPKQLLFSYLTAFTFWASIGLGGLFFVLLHHLTNATWSVSLRRFGEAAMMTLPLMAIFFLPIVFGLSDLYQWSDTQFVAQDHILSRKAGYLNAGFFITRTVIYFIIWSVLAVVLSKTSAQQDKEPSEKLTNKMRAVSTIGMLLFAITITFAFFDWIMSVDAYWYSTIFGVYIFGGAFLAILSFLVIMARYLRRNNILTDVVTIEHYHDLGKYLFAFIIFWSYIGFSQYFLIWYANIPEETIWFLHRWDGSWQIPSLILVFGHFAVPFFGLMPRSAKRNVGYLSAMALFILLMHWVDYFWLVMPTLHKHHAVVSWMDVTTMLGVGGFFVWFFWQRLTSRALIPVNDPKLQASIHFKNV